MATETIKSLREKADVLVEGGIKNKEALIEALPILTDLQAKTAFARKNLDSAVKTLKRLSELCSKYALSHESVFEKHKLIPSQQGVLVGNVVLDDATYHFASGYDGYERDDGEKMTQDFLATLPEKWRKSKTEISTSGINAAKPTADELTQYGLRQKPNNVWSVGNEVEN